MSIHSPHEQFVGRRLQPGETVDVFLAELRRVAVPFGGLSDKMLACAFVAGLSTVRQLLGAGSRMDEKPVCAGATKTGKPVCAGATKTEKPVCAGATKTEKPVCAGATKMEKPVFAGATKTEKPVCAGATKVENPASAGATKVEKPVCTGGDAIEIDEPDFCVSFEASEKAWTVTWKWSEDAEPDALRNRVTEYSNPISARLSYDAEIEAWVKNGWLAPCDDTKLGPAKGLIPLMAIFQQN